MQDEELPNKLLLTTRQSKISNVFANSILTDIKISKAQLSKIIQSGGFLGNKVGNVIGSLDKKAVIDLAVPLGKDVLPKLATKVTLFILINFKEKYVGKEL